MSMAERQQQYYDHQVWRMIEETIALIEGRDDVTEDDARSLEYIAAIYKLVLEWRDVYSPFISLGMLTILQNAVHGNVRPHLDQWIAGRNPALLNAAVMGVEAVLEATRGWPPTKDKQLRGLSAAVRQLVAESESQVESLKASVAQLQREVEDRLTTGTDLFTQQAQQAHDQLAATAAANTAAQATLDQILAKATQIDARVDSVMVSQQNNFTTAESERQRINAANITEQTAEFEGAIAQVITDSEAKLREQAATGDQILTRIGALEAQAKGLNEAAAVTITSTNYGGYAAEQKQEADKLRLWSVILFVAAFVAGVASWIIAVVSDDHSWQTTLVKATLTATLLAAAAYTATESSHHRDKEATAKSAQLRLAALEPFIANLDAKEKRIMRMAAARDLFIVKDTHPKAPIESEVDEEGG